MQIQAIIQEIVCIIDEDGSDRFGLKNATSINMNFGFLVTGILKSLFSIEMEDLIKVFKEEILGGTTTLIEGNY